MKIIKIKGSGELDGLHIWFDRDSKKRTLISKTAVNGASLDSLQFEYRKGNTIRINTTNSKVTCKVTDVVTEGNHTIYMCNASTIK